MKHFLAQTAVIIREYDEAIDSYVGKLGSYTIGGMGARLGGIPVFAVFRASKSHEFWLDATQPGLALA